MRIFKNRWFIRFARKEGISNAALCDAVGRAERGLVDADLGGGLIKQRVARQGEGRSGGYRTIIAFMSGQTAFFLFGFAKSDRENLEPAELSGFKKLAALLLPLEAPELNGQVKIGELIEVFCYDQDL